MIASINPWTGAVSPFEPHSESGTGRRIALSAQTFLHYRKTCFSQRAVWLQRAAEIVESEKRRLAEIMTAEMGKTVVSAEAEAAKCATVCRYYAANGAAALADEPIATHAPRCFVRYEPLGPVLAVMPWNFLSGRCFALRLPR